MEKMIVSSVIIRIFSSANYYYGKTVALLGLKVKIILCSGVMQWYLPWSWESQPCRMRVTRDVSYL